MSSIFLFLFFAYTAVSSTWAPDYDLAISKLIEITIVFVVLLGISLYTSNPYSDILLHSFFVFILFLSCFLFFFSGVDSSTGRLSALGGGANMLGRNSALAATSSLFLASRNEKSSLYIILFTLFSILCLASGSRGSILALSVSLAYLFLVKQMSFGKKLSLLLAVTSLTTVFLYTPIGGYAAEIFHDRFVVLLLQQEYYSGRPLLYQLALDIGRSYPIFGIGLNGFASTGISSYPHNLFLESFSEGGLISLFLLVLSLGLWCYWYIRNRHVIMPELVACWIVVFIASQFSGDLYDSRAVFLILLLIYSSQPQITKCN
jgi:O-antigen ligase